MKNLVIIIGTIILGVFVFNMMTGEEETSLKSVSENIMRQTIERYGQEG